MLKVGQQKHKFVNKYSKTETCFGVGIQGHNSVCTLERTIIYNVAVWCELTDFEGGGFWSSINSDVEKN